MDQWELTPGFHQRLEQDGFVSIGWYEIKEGNKCEITVSHEASDWEFSIASPRSSKTKSLAS
jgi:hypothetical protein